MPVQRASSSLTGGLATGRQLLRAAGITAGACYALGGWPPGQGAAGLILLWAPPMAWLTAPGMLVAVAVRSPAAASGLVGGIWLAQFLLSHDMQANAVLRAQYLFITLADGFPRSDVAITQAALLARPERLLAGDAA